jgi:hypothetical protein
MLTTANHTHDDVALALDLCVAEAAGNGAFRATIALCALDLVVRCPDTESNLQRGT